MFGRGFGQSIQKFSSLPEPIGDSIFAVFAEEWDLLEVSHYLFCFSFLHFVVLNCFEYDKFCKIACCWDYFIDNNSIKYKYCINAWCWSSNRNAFDIRKQGWNRSVFCSCVRWNYIKHI